MSVTQSLKTVVSLGGVVDASFGRMNGAINKSMASATKKVKMLESEQKKLSSSIRKGKLAGKDVSALGQDYQALTKKIAKAREEAKGFNALGSVRDSLSGGVTVLKDVGVAAAGTTASVVTLVTATNSVTASQHAMAKSYGMTIEQFKAWGGVAKDAELDAESVGDLIEELSNKFGEFKALGDQSTVSDVFGKLGITQDMLDGLSAAEQFEFVMNRLNGLSDTQEAASLADMLFGGEANKLVTYIKGTGQGIDSLLSKQREINKLTSAGAKGATRYQKSWTRGLSIVSSSWQDISGKVGGKLAPIIDGLSTKIGHFVDTHQSEIDTFVDNVVTGITTFASTVYEVAGAVNTAVDAIGGWGTVLNVVLSVVAAKGVVQFALFAGNVKTLITTISTAGTVMKAFNLIVRANPIGLAVTAVAALISGLVTLANKFGIIKKLFGDDEEDDASSKGEAQQATKKSRAVTRPRTYGGYGQYASKSAYSPYQGYGPTRSYTDKADLTKGKENKAYPGYYHSATKALDESEPQDTPRYGNYGAKAQKAVQSVQTNHSQVNKTHITTKVEKIEVITSPEQDPKEVGQGVLEEINNAGGQGMYDYNYGV